jgi:Ferric reductase like transmembrane component/FAD-binding domain
MMGLEFALVARFRPLAAPFGQDALLQFHRQTGYVGLAFILIHFAISAKWNELTLAKALAAPLLVWFGMAALLSLVVLIASSVWRQRLRLSYEAWHITHTVLALVLVVGALLHVFFVDEYVGSLWKQILWGLMSAAFVGLLLWVRLVKPRRALARPWRLERVVAERGQTTRLVLKPPPAAKFRFQPGQFAWFAIGRSPFSITQHPFSFASSAERDDVELAVRALGDFTSRASELEPGTTVYVDGPHGVFSIDQDEGPGFGFIRIAAIGDVARSAQRLRAAAYVLAALVLAAAAAALALSPDRRRTVTTLGVGATVAGVTIVVVLTASRAAVLGHVSGAEERAARARSGTRIRRTCGHGAGSSRAPGRWSRRPRRRSSGRWVSKARCARGGGAPRPSPRARRPARCARSCSSPPACS